jgi:peptidyl-tRNA hydrolase, PTH2 family
MPSTDDTLKIDKVKQVIIIRKDLKMRRGKEIAQGSHASGNFMVKSLREKGYISLEELGEVTKEWIFTGQTKVCLIVRSEEELNNLYEEAVEMGLETSIITDAGRTEFNGVPTKTALSIGPDFSSRIDKITKHLKLY